jgi:hypothetical protein
MKWDKESFEEYKWAYIKEFIWDKLYMFWHNVIIYTLVKIKIIPRGILCIHYMGKEEQDGKIIHFKIWCEKRRCKESYRCPIRNYDNIIDYDPKLDVSFGVFAKLLRKKEGRWLDI